MRKKPRVASRPRRIAEILRWTFRERNYRRMSFILFLVIVFTLVSNVSKVGGSSPEEVVPNVLHSAGAAPLSAYPFLFALVSMLATLTIIVPRNGGAFAALQALGYRREEILLAQSLSMLTFTLLPTLAAFLVLPPFVEPSLLLRGELVPLYPLRYWIAIPRTLLAIVFLTLSAAAIGMVIRRVALAFVTMLTFFFIGWYLGITLGFPYGGFAPVHAFGSAYGYSLPVSGIPLDPNYTFLLYLAIAAAAYILSLVYIGLRGELQ